LIEIRIHGRGGQGAVLAAELVVVAAFEDGKFGQAFPAFGGERRGAPVQAFVRLDSKPVRVRYRVLEPHYVLVLDRILPNMVDVMAGLRTEGVLLIDTVQSPTTLAWSQEAKVLTVPATGIAMEVFGLPLVNPVMLGALAAVSGQISLPAIQTAFRRRFPGSMGEKNSLAAQLGYDFVHSQAAVTVKVSRTGQVPASSPYWEADLELGAPGRAVHFASVVAPRTSLAYLTGTWRYTQPLVDPQLCNGCGLCETFCPDGSLRIIDRLAIVDYAYCKGCGICAQVCVRKAILMSAEEG
jgi:pyruvate ferredoxin oxidoreductase gamma subunit